MKASLILLHTMILFGLTNLSAQSDSKTVNILFRNNGILPRKFSFITYSPGDSSNDVFADFIFPGFSKKLKLKPGTKVYLANQKEVNSVMSGKKIDTQKPFYTVQATDNNTGINLRQ
jgi:hypothetical protein